jgi:hypothetical protein
MDNSSIEGFTGLKKYNNFEKKNDGSQWKINDLLQNSSLLDEFGVKNDKTFKNLEYDSKYNGLVNIMTDEMDMVSERFSMQDKIPVEESSDFREALNGIMENSTLSKVFFCKENIQIIQNGIRSNVYNCTNLKHIIGEQPTDIIKIIMRSIFFQNAKHLSSNITNQVEDLNKLVINECSKSVKSQLDSYLKYKKDISTLATPIDRPQSTYTNQSLEFRGHFEQPSRNNNVEVKPRIFSDVEIIGNMHNPIEQKFNL